MWPGEVPRLPLSRASPHLASRPNCDPRPDIQKAPRKAAATSEAAKPSSSLPVPPGLLAAVRPEAFRPRHRVCPHTIRHPRLDCQAMGVNNRGQRVRRRPQRAAPTERIIRGTTWDGTMCDSRALQAKATKRRNFRPGASEHARL
jgi:hypothetical protein